MAVPEGAPSAGALLRAWRQRRNLSQLELALRSAVSARHLSFIETGRARPSREMVLHLAERLDVPLRERNQLLLAAGFAPVFGERSLDESEMAPVREALERFLSAHEPYPALAVDRHWNIVAANRGIAYVTRGVAGELRVPPANALRIALHPDGMAPRISNLADWSGYVLGRLRRELEATRDPELDALYEELVAYPGVTEHDPAGSPAHPIRTTSCSCTSFASTTQTSPFSAPSRPSERPATSRLRSSRSWPSTRPTRRPPKRSPPQSATPTQTDRG